MNINDYISSGILEQYVLGDTTPQERKEVECMSHIYPEIKEELNKVQIALEGFALDNAIEVPTHIKKNIFDQIEKEEVLAPVIPAKVVEFKLATIASTENKKSNKKYLVAASLALLIGASSVYFILNSNYQNKELALNNKIETINKENAASEQSLKNQLAILSDENNKSFILQGDAKKAAGKSMVVLWNNKTGNVYVNNVQLPQTPTDKQYQLWALKDGKPIDLGVFNATEAIQNMKTVEGAQAFAVTLEPKGGSSSPHLEELYGLVKVSG